MISSNWVLDPDKFLTREEVNRLPEKARKRAAAAITRGNKVAVRDYFIVDLALSTGLRVAEMADLKCKDIFLRDRFCALLVRNGKGGKKRLVRFNGAFKGHYNEYIVWKQTVGEPTGPGKSFRDISLYHPGGEYSGQAVTFVSVLKVARPLIQKNARNVRNIAIGPKVQTKSPESAGTTGRQSRALVKVMIARRIAEVSLFYNPHKNYYLTRLFFYGNIPI